MRKVEEAAKNNADHDKIEGLADQVTALEKLIYQYYLCLSLYLLMINKHLVSFSSCYLLNSPYGIYRFDLTQ
jgi:hypothetical protein